MKLTTLLTLSATAVAIPMKRPSNSTIPTWFNSTLPGYNTTLPLNSTSNGTSSNAPFTVIAARSASPIHLEPVVASGGAFYVGGETRSYCPEVLPKGACPRGDETVIVGGGSLDVEVPGGQQIYVSPTGALSFTSPHSAYMPSGSSTGHFTFTEPSESGSFGHWTYNNASSFIACPVAFNSTSKNVTETRWQVFVGNATASGVNATECLGFSALAIPWTGYAGNVTAGNSTGSAGAWEYI